MYKNIAFEILIVRAKVTCLRILVKYNTKTNG